MLSAFGRKCLVAVGLCASLCASASAYGIGGGGGGGSTATGVIIVAPATVQAGLPIVGYLTGGALPMNLIGTSGGNWLPCSATSSYSDPVDFVIQTFEPMKRSVVTISASGGEGSSDTVGVLVL